METNTSIFPDIAQLLDVDVRELLEPTKLD